MGQYASDTSVSVASSIAEIQRTVERYGADGFGFGRQGERAMVEFVTDETRVRFVLQLPEPRSREFTHTPNRGTARTADQAHKAWEQACRQRWRALCLVIKAKLEAVESGIVEFREEFMAHIVLPDGTTFGSHAIPAIEKAYLSGNVDLKLLPEADVIDGEIVEP